MAHDYSNVTGQITASGSLVGWVKGDFSLERSVGRYITVGSEVADHVKGPKSVSGSLTKAWGISTSTLYSWFNNFTEFDIVFDPNTDGSTGETYTCSGCVITDISGSMEADSEGALEIDASFEGRDWSSS